MDKPSKKEKPKKFASSVSIEIGEEYLKQLDKLEDLGFNYREFLSTNVERLIAAATCVALSKNNDQSQTEKNPQL